MRQREREEGHIPASFLFSSSPPMISSNLFAPSPFLTRPPPLAAFFYLQQASLKLRHEDLVPN